MVLNVHFAFSFNVINWRVQHYFSVEFFSYSSVGQSLGWLLNFMDFFSSSEVLFRLSSISYDAYQLLAPFSSYRVFDRFIINHILIFGTFLLFSFLADGQIIWKSIDGIKYHSTRSHVLPLFVFFLFLCMSSIIFHKREKTNVNRWNRTFRF